MTYFASNGWNLLFVYFNNLHVNLLMLTFKPNFFFFFNLNPYIVLPRWRDVTKRSSLIGGHFALVYLRVPRESTWVTCVAACLSVCARRYVSARSRSTGGGTRARRQPLWDAVWCREAAERQEEFRRYGPWTGPAVGGGCCRTADPLKDPSVRPEQRHGARRRKRTATRRRRGEQRGAWGRLRPHTGWFTWTWTAGFRRYGGGAGTG